MDEYRALLKKYIRYMRAVEGTDYIELDKGMFAEEFFTDAEWRELNILSEEINGNR